MTRRRVQIALLGLVLAIVGVRPALAQDEPRVSFSTSVDYSVGDYGTGKDTTLVYVPFTLGVRPFDRFWLSVTVPYLYQTGQNVVLTGGGVAVKGKKSNGKLTRPATSTTESGLGDVLAKASFILIPEKEFIPEITPYFKVKFPTADKDRSLGTGELMKPSGSTRASFSPGACSDISNSHIRSSGSPRGPRSTTPSVGAWAPRMRSSNPSPSSRSLRAPQLSRPARTIHSTFESVRSTGSSRR
jgi:hypothetical protein